MPSCGKISKLRRISRRCQDIPRWHRHQLASTHINWCTSSFKQMESNSISWIMPTERKLQIHQEKSLNHQPTNYPTSIQSPQPTPTNTPKPVLISHDVQKGLLLSCEGSIWQIFCSGGGSYCEGEFLITTRDALPLSLHPKIPTGNPQVFEVTKKDQNKKKRRQFCWYQ